jgi:hypothetical protein
MECGRWGKEEIWCGENIDNKKPVTQGYRFWLLL